MIGLVTMLVTTLGATGMGSILKIAGGLVQSLNEAREKKAERELARDLAMSGHLLQNLLGLLGVLLLCSGCSTFLSSQSYVQFGQTSPSSLLHPQNKKKSIVSSLDSSKYQQTTVPQRQSLQDISHLSRLPLWGQSSDSTSHQEVKSRKAIWNN